MSFGGSSGVSSDSVVLSCDSAELTPHFTRSAEMPPVDSDAHSSTTSDDANSSEAAFESIPERLKTSTTLTVYVKGDPTTKSLKDCYYCQRVLLILEEKEIPYRLEIIDPRHRPEWLVAAMPSGHLPILQDGEAFVSETGRIADFIEEKYPQPSLSIDEEGMSAGGGIFAAFRRFLRNRDNNREDQCRQRLEDELECMNQYLELDGGPFFGRACFSSADIALSPRLYRMAVALQHFKGWKIPDAFSMVVGYLMGVSNRPSFRKTCCTDAEIIASWKQNLFLDAPHLVNSSQN